MSEVAAPEKSVCVGVSLSCVGYVVRVGAVTMKDLQKKFLTVAASPYSIPSNQQIITDNLQLPLQHLNTVQMPNYLLSGVPLQNSSGWFIFP